ncbi:MAG: riboflavin kinase [Phycisphaerales bacterium]
MSATAITIGTFDGVHRGHAALVAAARDAAGDGGRVVVLCFDPHPLSVLRPDAAPLRLSTFRQRRHWLRAAGADDVIALEPTDELLGQSPEAFLDWVMSEYSPDVIVEGRDFRFGQDRSGCIQTIAAHARAAGYRAITVDDVEGTLTDGSVVRITSSIIRWLICAGRVRDAALLLGHPYVICGPVVRGDGRGGPDLGMPTANIDPCQTLPADGIYAGLATGPDGLRYPAAVSVGTKPTFGENPRVCEAHLIGLDPDTDKYGWTLRLEFHEWLRDQVAFEGIDHLVEQMHRDVARVQEAMATKVPGSHGSHGHTHDPQSAEDERILLQRHR